MLTSVCCSFVHSYVKPSRLVMLGGAGVHSCGRLARQQAFMRNCPRLV